MSAGSIAGLLFVLFTFGPARDDSGPRLPPEGELSRPCHADVPGACPHGHVCDLRGGIGRCAAVFSDPRALVGRLEAWVGRYVAIRAELEPDLYACTLMLCGHGSPCCNHCQGFARPKGTDISRIDGTVCLGDECEAPSCGVIDARGFNVLDGAEVELRGRVVAEQGEFRLKDVIVGVERGASTVLLVPEQAPYP